MNEPKIPAFLTYSVSQSAAAVPRVIGRGPGTPTGGPGRRVALRVFKFKFRVPGAGPLKLATSEAQRRRPGPARAGGPGPGAAAAGRKAVSE